MVVPPLDTAKESERDFLTRMWKNSKWSGTDRMRLLCMAENILEVGKLVAECELTYEAAYGLLKDLKNGYQS
jgi:hypothetical protein